MTEPPTLPSGMDNLDVDIDVFDGGLFSCVRPADKLEGRVRVASKQPLHFTRAEVYLHGEVTMPIQPRPTILNRHYYAIQQIY
jgi:hypothetical protein